MNKKLPAHGISLILSRSWIMLLCCFSITAYGQSLTGKVIDTEGSPIPGASIIVKNTTKGTQTDSEGNFTLNGVASTETIVASFIGYLSQEKRVGNLSVINFTLEEDNQSLNEVVVIGYGTVKKSDLTGSVASVKVDELVKGVTTSTDQLLTGVAGANVVQNSGEPGSSFSINVRGAGSVSAGNEPLYVIDGFPVNNVPAIGSGSIVGFSGNRSPTNPLASLNPQDIESIEILKDASAAAIYGSRGANGVVLITTKRGKEGAGKVSYQASVGVQQRFNKLDLLNPQDYKRVLNQIIDEGGGLPSERIGEIANGGLGRDWQDEILNKGALIQNHQLAFSGGTAASKYFISLNTVNQEGIIQSSDFNRYSLRFNLDSQLNQKFRIGLTANASYSTSNYIPNGFSTNEDAGAMYAAINFDPTLDIFDSNGNYQISSILSIDNPLALLNGATATSRNNRILATIFGEYKIFDGLNAKLSIGGDMVNEKRENYNSRLTKNGQAAGGIASNQEGEIGSYLVEGTLNYVKEIGIHSFNILGGASYQKFSTSRINIGANSFPSDALLSNNLSLGNQATFFIFNPTISNSLASLIGRADYVLNNKYSATLTVRRDGSSRFGANNRYGTFPSAAVAWKLMEENFLKELNAISFLKLRASWGLTGNQEIGDFAFQTTYAGADPAIWDGNLVTATAPTRLPNPDLKWETTEQINVGLDFGFLKNRIQGSVDYFTKVTTDMLLNLPIPQSTGFATVLTNVGEIENNGIEVVLTTKNINRGAFSWESNVTFTTLRNNVVDLGGIPEINSGAGFLHVPQVGIIRPGEPLNSFFGWEVAGVWQTGDDFTQTKDNVKPGSLKYVDQNGDGIVNEKDRVILGNSFPDIQWSFSNTFRFKGAELFIFMDGVEGAQMLNGNLIETYFPINYRRNKLAEPLLNRWTPTNPSNVHPSFVDPLSQGRKTVNSLTVQDASYIRLRNVRISYELPKFSKNVQNAKVFVGGENLFISTKYDGLDPTINPNNNASLRVDFNAYPTAKTYLAGLLIEL